MKCLGISTTLQAGLTPTRSWVTQNEHNDIFVGTLVNFVLFGIFVSLVFCVFVLILIFVVLWGFLEFLALLFLFVLKDRKRT